MNLADPDAEVYQPPDISTITFKDFHREQQHVQALPWSEAAIQRASFLLHKAFNDAYQAPPTDDSAS
jgi:hypothetical protein